MRATCVGAIVLAFGVLLSTGLAQLPALPAVPGAAAVPSGAAAAGKSIWQFLGFKGGARLKRLRDALVNRRGNFPGLEKKPRLKALTDPDNLASDNPAIKEAAQAKSDADAAPQKVKAIKYLATVGCSSNGCNPGIKKALLAALDDCTEEVRFEAAKAFLKTAGEKCDQCRQSCCDQETSDKLFQIAYDRNDRGCFVETSPRVRKAARQALCLCCQPGPGGPVPPPKEGPQAEELDVPEKAGEGAPPQTAFHHPRANDGSPVRVGPRAKVFDLGRLMVPAEPATRVVEQQTATTVAKAAAPAAPPARIVSAPAVPAGAAPSQPVTQATAAEAPAQSPIVEPPVVPAPAPTAPQGPVEALAASPAGPQLAPANPAGQTAVYEAPAPRPVPMVLKSFLKKTRRPEGLEARPDELRPEIIVVAHEEEAEGAADEEAMEAPAPPRRNMGARVQAGARANAHPNSAARSIIEEDAPLAARSRFMAETSRIAEGLTPEEAANKPANIARPWSKFIQKSTSLPDEEFFLRPQNSFQKKGAPQQRGGQAPVARSKPQPGAAPRREVVEESIPEPQVAMDEDPDAEEAPEPEAIEPGKLQVRIPSELTGGIKLFSMHTQPAAEGVKPDIGSELLPLLAGEDPNAEEAPEPVAVAPVEPEPEEAPLPKAVTTPGSDLVIRRPPEPAEEAPAPEPVSIPLEAESPEPLVTAPAPQPREPVAAPIPQEPAPAVSRPIVEAEIPAEEAPEPAPMPSARRGSRLVIRPMPQAEPEPQAEVEAPAPEPIAPMPPMVVIKPEPTPTAPEPAAEPRTLEPEVASEEPIDPLPLVHRRIRETPEAPAPEPITISTEPAPLRHLPPVSRIFAPAGKRPTAEEAPEPIQAFTQDDASQGATPSARRTRRNAVEAEPSAPSYDITPAEPPRPQAPALRVVESPKDDLPADAEVLEAPEPTAPAPRYAERIAISPIVMPKARPEPKGADEPELIEAPEPKGASRQTVGKQAPTSEAAVEIGDPEAPLAPITLPGSRRTQAPAEPVEKTPAPITLPGAKKPAAQKSDTAARPPVGDEQAAPITLPGSSRRRTARGGASDPIIIQQSYIVEEPLEPAGSPRLGLVRSIDAKLGCVELAFTPNDVPPVGAIVKLHRRYPQEVAYLGEVEILSIAPGKVTARPIGWLRVERLNAGDEAVFLAR